MRTGVVLASALTVSACATTPLPSYEHSETLSWGHEFYYASVSAAGSNLCDSEARDYAAAEFEERFGRHFRRFRERHKEVFGQPNSAIVLASCRLLVGSLEEFKSRHARDMDAFDVWLTRSEKELEAHLQP